jgi:hypothetical protein
VSWANLLLWAGGIVLIALGYARARGPWRRYQELRAQEENIARYEAWRGGVRRESATGASVAMALALRQARRWGAVALVGFLLVFAGFALR